WEQAFIPVHSDERSTVKIAVDGIAARMAEVLGAVTILLWLRGAAPHGVLRMPLETRWMAWATLGIVIVWLAITQRLRVQATREATSALAPPPDIDCERFPDQCPCTTELGKGIA
ncbi:MAG TPA: hypothetical protein VLA17_10300, partial [Candidatus Limnocylindria bacterium]|nr:hypothetical protein [Candidatus Limnocylindria bacterium]